MYICIVMYMFICIDMTRRARRPRRAHHVDDKASSFMELHLLFSLIFTYIYIYIHVCMIMYMFTRIDMSRRARRPRRSHHVDNKVGVDVVYMKPISNFHGFSLS